MVKPLSLRICRLDKAVVVFSISKISRGGMDSTVLKVKVARLQRSQILFSEKGIQPRSQKAKEIIRLSIRHKRKLILRL